jgi:tetratricopeptide (TPR) repeat protein
MTTTVEQHIDHFQEHFVRITKEVGRSEEGEYQRALAAYQRSQELDPIAPAVNMNLGMVLCQAGRVDDARRSFELMIDYEPDFANGWWALAYCEAHGPRIGAAIRAYRKAISLGLQNANLYGQLAFAYIDLGDYESAATWVERSLAFDANSSWGWAAQRSLYVSKKEYQTFLQDALMRYQAHPESMEMIVNAASAQASAGNFAETLRLYKLVDTSSPQVQASLFDQYDAEWGWLDSLTLAMAEMKAGDRVRAEKLL